MTYYTSDIVLVTTADGEVTVATTVATMEMPEDGPHGWFVEGVATEVLAWMPLPEPYKEEE